MASANHLYFKHFGLNLYRNKNMEKESEEGEKAKKTPSQK